MSLPVILLGAGGHGRVLLDVLLQQLFVVLYIADPRCERTRHLFDIPLINDDQALLGYPAAEIRLVNGLGSSGDTSKRRQIYEYFKEYGYEFATVIHQSAVVSQRTELGEGVQVMAGAIIQTGVKIGGNTIVNTRATIDHDCIIGKHAHIAPGAILSGGIRVGDGAHVGAGATVMQGLTIGRGSIIGAGAVVIGDVPENAVVVGVPARIIKYKEG
jgi:sugar O-acyltransferase (sialic acid O-acetyltransferase NeuD family)